MKTPLTWAILKHFSLKNVKSFTYKEVLEAFPGRNHAYLAQVLADMVKFGMLYKISRGIYHIVPLNADPTDYLPDGFLQAKYLMNKEEYYIGYGSALKIHGCSFQPKSGVSVQKIIVVTRKQIRPTRIDTGNRTFQFVYHGDDRFFGFSELWINRSEKAVASDLEKTIVDMASNPTLCGGIIPVAHALSQTKVSVENDKLFHYLGKNLNNAANKRILWLSEILELEWTSQHEKMLSDFRKGISLLDPSQADRGKTNQKYKLKINVDPDLIRKQIQR